MKWFKKLYECSLEELLERRKFLKIYNLICLVIGALYMGAGMGFYFKTGLVGLPIMLFIIGISLLNLSVIPNNLDVFIYLKMKEN